MLKNEELEKVSGGEIFKIIPSGKGVENFIINNTDSEGNWSCFVAPEVIRYLSPYYVVGSNPNALNSNEKKHCYYNLSDAEEYARRMHYSTNIIEIYDEVDF